MSRQERLLTRASELSRAGKREDACLLLQAIVREDPHNEGAWLQYVRTLPTMERQIAALKEFLRVEPGNARAQAVLWMLWEKKCDAAQAEQVTQRAADRRYRVLGFASLALFLVTLGALLVGAVWLRQSVLDRWANRYAALSVEYEQLQQDYRRARDAHTTLQTRHSVLQQSHERLEKERDLLVDEQNLLIGEHETLQAEYGALQQEHAQLQQAHDGLTAEHAVLRGQFDGLQQDYDLLTGEFDWFRSEAIVPPYICTSGRNVQIAFRRTDQSVEQWEVPFESFERSIERGMDSRENLLFELGAMTELHNTTTGEDYYVWDFGAFVDPDPFRQVMYDLYTELGDDDAFVREVWHIVAQLTTYSEEIEETPRYPLETFLAGGGDCEDTAILLASMIEAAPVNWAVDLVYMDIDHPQDPQDVNHVIVYVDTGQEQYLIETTADEEMEPFDDVVGWYLEVE